MDSEASGWRSSVARKNKTPLVRRSDGRREGYCQYDIITHIRQVKLLSSLLRSAGTQRDSQLPRPLSSTISEDPGLGPHRTRSPHLPALEISQGPSRRRWPQAFEHHRPQRQRTLRWLEPDKRAGDPPHLPLHSPLQTRPERRRRTASDTAPRTRHYPAQPRERQGQCAVEVPPFLSRILQQPGQAGQLQTGRNIVSEPIHHLVTATVGKCLNCV